MTILKRYGFFIMILVILSELIVPFVLIAFYPHYNPITMLISDFGEDGSPTKMVFKMWQLVDGSLFLLAVPSFYERFKRTSKSLAIWLSVMISTFAIGDCLVTGIFDRSPSVTTIDIEAMIHDYASGAGFVALLIAIFLLIKLYILEENQLAIRGLFIVFILSACFMFLFAEPKIPIVRELQIPYRGLWQRANLLFLYLPFFFVACGNLDFRK
ncbi:hypothetical protein ATZ33_03765 [Enterococcus silesiacus]|nr:DUF998 domain-containing protein [Enterococcus silesiacus]ALS00518.1 hypothetical protein ATZ33_03765 [Enterococcus silesiacus]